jgi:hypothetical protein
MLEAVTDPLGPPLRAAELPRGGFHKRRLRSRRGQFAPESDALRRACRARPMACQPLSIPAPAAPAVIVSDDAGDAGEAAIGTFILRLMGFADVKVALP